MSMNLIMKTTVSAVVAAAVFAGVVYFMKGAVDVTGAVVFLVIYWISFFGTQKYLFKRGREG